jgi:uncharacterized DUF497 family protein
MPYVELIWDLDDDPDGNTSHISEHGLTKDDVAHAFSTAYKETRSNSTGREIVFGFTADRRRIAVVYEVIDDVLIYPVTTYEV